MQAWNLVLLTIKYHACCTWSIAFQIALFTIQHIQYHPKTLDILESNVFGITM